MRGKEWAWCVCVCVLLGGGITLHSMLECFSFKDDSMSVHI